MVVLISLIYDEKQAGNQTGKAEDRRDGKVQEDIMGNQQCSTDVPR